MSNGAPPPPPPPGPPGPPPGGNQYGNQYGGGYGGGFGGPSTPPPGGYPEPDGWDVAATVRYGWERFLANAGAMVLAALAIFVGFVVLTAVAAAVMFTGADRGIGAGELGLLLGLYALFFVFAQVIGAGLIREAIGVTEGRPFTVGGVFAFHDIGTVIATSLLVGLGTLVGTILCVLPGVVFAFMSMYALFFVVGRGLGPVEAIKASIHLVKDNLGPTIIWYLVATVIMFLGQLACGVGLLAAIPVVLLGTASTFAQLTGRPVAP